MSEVLYHDPAPRDAITLALLEQLAMLGVPHQDEALPSDPASEGFDVAGTGLGPTGLGAMQGTIAASMADSMASQNVGDAVGGLVAGHSPGVNASAPGTGLGLAVTGYNAGYGHAHDAHSAQADAITSGVIDAMAASNAVDAAINGAPDNSGAAIAADAAGPLGALSAAVNDAVSGYTSDPGGPVDSGPGGAPGGPGDSGPGAGISADAGVSGGFSGGVDAGGGISW